jgi:hypothetical protein
MGQTFPQSAGRYFSEPVSGAHQSIESFSERENSYSVHLEGAPENGLASFIFARLALAARVCVPRAFHHKNSQK